MKTQVIPFKEFMAGSKPKEENKIIVHFKKHGETYIKVAGLTAIVLIAPHGAVFASSGIDVGAEQLYRKLVGIGKWVIIFKGGFEVLKACGEGNFDSAKKGFLGYVLTYLLLMALPYLMGQVEVVFQGLK